MTDIELTYLAPLQTVREALRAGNMRTHVAQRLGLLQNQPGMHFHPHSELFIQFAGRRRFTCPLETFDIHNGELCLMPPQVPHRENAFNGHSAPFDGIVLWFERDTFSIHRSIVRENGGRPSVGPNLRLPLPDAANLSQLLENATAISEPDIRDPLLYSLLGLVRNNLRDHNATRPRTPPEPSAAIVESARAIIHAYLPDANLSVARIATEVGCSAAHLSRCFQKHLGLCAQGYLQSERLSLACRLLQKPNLRVSEVASACGFNSANYFIRAFRQQTGQTPNQYRHRS